MGRIDTPRSRLFLTVGDCNPADDFKLTKISAEQLKVLAGLLPPEVLNWGRIGTGARHRQAAEILGLKGYSLSPIFGTQDWPLPFTGVITLADGTQVSKEQYHFDIRAITFAFKNLNQGTIVISDQDIAFHIEPFASAVKQKFPISIPAIYKFQFENLMTKAVWFYSAKEPGGCILYDADQEINLEEGDQDLI